MADFIARPREKKNATMWIYIFFHSSLDSEHAAIGILISAIVVYSQACASFSCAVYREYFLLDARMFAQDSASCVWRTQTHSHTHMTRAWHEQIMKCASAPGEQRKCRGSRENPDLITINNSLAYACGANRLRWLGTSAEYLTSILNNCVWVGYSSRSSITSDDDINFKQNYLGGC